MCVGVLVATQFVLTVFDVRDSAESDAFRVSQTCETIHSLPSLTVDVRDPTPGTLCTLLYPRLTKHTLAVESDT